MGGTALWKNIVHPYVWVKKEIIGCKETVTCELFVSCFLYRKTFVWKKVIYNCKLQFLHFRGTIFILTHYHFVYWLGIKYNWNDRIQYWLRIKASLRPGLKLCFNLSLQKMQTGVPISLCNVNKHLYYETPTPKGPKKKLEARNGEGGSYQVFAWSFRNKEEWILKRVHIITPL